MPIQPLSLPCVSVMSQALGSQAEAKHKSERSQTLLCACNRVADPNSDAQRTFASELKTAIPALVICLSVGGPAPPPALQEST